VSHLSSIPCQVIRETHKYAVHLLAEVLTKEIYDTKASRGMLERNTWVSDSPYHMISRLKEFLDEPRGNKA
jgi:hypothetical protein